MSRLDEIIKSEMSENAALRTLAAEVDARDEVITKLLAMLKPGEKPIQVGGDLATACDSALAGAVRCVGLGALTGESVYVG